MYGLLASEMNCVMQVAGGVMYCNGWNGALASSEVTLVFTDPRQNNSSNGERLSESILSLFAASERLA